MPFFRELPAKLILLLHLLLGFLTGWFFVQGIRLLLGLCHAGKIPMTGLFFRRACPPSCMRAGVYALLKGDGRMIRAARSRRKSNCSVGTRKSSIGWACSRETR